MASAFPTLEEYFMSKESFDMQRRVVMPFHREIMEALTQCVTGTLPNGKTKLGINMPPGHGKTWIVESFVEWAQGIFPDARSIYASFSEPMAELSTSNIKSVIQDEWYREIFPWVKLNDFRRLDFFRTSEGGYVKGVGFNGTIRGFRGGRMRKEYGGAIIIDDPLKATNTDCVNESLAAFNTYTNTLENRRNRHDTPIIAIGQRVAPMDFFGHLYEKEKDQWHILRFPCIDSEGNALWPEVKDKQYWMNLQELDECAFWAQGMQSPIVPGGNIIKRSWWKYYNPDNYNVDGLVIITADTAMKKNDRSDNHSFQCWNLTAQNCDLLDEISGKWDFATSMRKASEFWHKWTRFGVVGFYIEEKASGIPLATMLDQIGIQCILWNPTRYQFPVDKIGRVKFSNFYIEAGRVRLPINSDITEHMIDQAANFTGDDSVKDDSVDSMTMAVSIWKSKGGGFDVKAE